MQVNDQCIAFDTTQTDPVFIKTMSSDKSVLFDALRALSEKYLRSDEVDDNEDKYPRHELLFQDKIHIDDILHLHQIVEPGICLDREGMVIKNGISSHECIDKEQANDKLQD